MNHKKIAIKNKEKSKISSKDSLLDELLISRNIKTKEEIKKFLNPSKDDFISPYAYSDMKKAKDRINEAINKNQKILIWGDFDCDGVTSTTVLYKALNELKANVLYYIPDRLSQGHGLDSKILLNFISKENVKLVITVDCGISSNKEINLLKSLGTDTIITDHHTTDTELPKAYAIINPQVSEAIDDKLDIKTIEYLTYNSGSIVSYKLAMALLEESKNQKLKDELLVISSCGAIADVVPLLGENRAMVTYALDLLNTKKEEAHFGIYNLLSQNIKGRNFTSEDIGFILAPRINAVGRLSDASLSFEFLNTTNNQKIKMIIEQLNNYNAIRQSKCLETYNEIKKYLDDNPKEAKNPAIILINQNWHIGVIGIVAAKITEQYSKPCFLMTIDDNNFARCSIRSNDLINVYQTLKENEDLFDGFGGHKLAGGFSFDLNKKSFEEVKSSLLKTIKENSDENKNDDTLYADIELSSNDLELDIINSINKLEPFGEGNEPPLFAMFDVTLESFKFLGKDKNHLKMIFSKDGKQFEGVRWKDTEILITEKQTCDIAFYLRLNVFNDVESLQLEIVDIYSDSIVKKEKEFKIFDHRRKTGILDKIAEYLEKDDLDIKVWAKTINTKEILSKYQKIKDNFLDKVNFHKGLMLFDYPNNIDELKNLISSVSPCQLHLMKFNIDENIENYIKQLIGMLKYSSNKLNGRIDIKKMSDTIGLSENFVQIALEILDDMESIEILDVNEIKYIKPFNYTDFKNSSMFEVLYEEFENIIEFKKTLLNCNTSEFEQLICL